MSISERAFRSRLAQLIDQRGMLRGTLLARVCLNVFLAFSPPTASPAESLGRLTFD